MGRRRHSRVVQEAGFTLIEMLVALSIFSIGVLALLNVQSESVRGLSQVEERALAHIVADNRLLETMATAEPPPIGTRRGEAELAGQRWLWLEVTAETAQPAIHRIDVSIRREAGGDVLASLSAFRRVR